VAVIAEAPGKVENLVGKPLVGPAGQLLDKCLSEAGLDLTDIMYFNVVSCYPNGTPEALAIAACRVNLEHQLLICRAKHVLLLGRIALQSFIPEAKITKLRGKTFEQDEKTYFIALHPSAILRNQDWKEQWVADLEAFARLVKEAPQFDLGSVEPLGWTKIDLPSSCPTCHGTPGKDRCPTCGIDGNADPS
jgi:DNA polymerase